MEKIITLTVLTNSFEEFKSQATSAAAFAKHIQIDVMDGTLVPNVSFSERDSINELNVPLKYELHLMVADPIAEMRTWQNVENVFRVLFHYESAPSDILRAISFIRKEGWEVGLAINPETALGDVEEYLDKIDVLQFMTVHPGRQGAPFEPSVVDKIKTLSGRATRPIIAVDGSVNANTIDLLDAAGVEIFNVGSYFTKASDMKAAYEILQSKITHQP